MKNTNRSLVVIGLIVLVVLLVWGAYYAMDRNTADETGTSATQDQASGDAVTNGSAGTPAGSVAGQPAAAQPKTYSGTFYSFSYPADWDVRETNRLTGMITLYPKSMAKQLADKTISTTDTVSISLVDPKPQTLDLTNAPTISEGGITWHIVNRQGTPDGGTENETLEYYAKFDRDTYVVLSSGSSKRSMIESLIESFALKQ